MFCIQIQMYFYSITHAGSVARHSEWFGEGFGPVQFTSFQCDGTETRIQDCPYTTQNNCTHSTDAGISCVSKSNIMLIGTLKVEGKLQHPQFVLLVTSDWLEVLLHMKDVLNFALTMPGAPSVMMDLMKVMPMSSVVSLAILIKVININFIKHINPSFCIIIC